MNVLVTGANGQLGKELEKLFTDENSLTFVGTDVDTLDITDENAIKAFVDKHAVNYIVNCAAYTAVDMAEDEADLAYSVNADAVGKLARVTKNNKIGFITISTDYVFNGEFFKPIDENDIPNPVSVYGKSKLEGERLSISGNPETIIIRTSWLYSIYGKNFVKTILNLAGSRKELSVIDEQIGTPTYAGDLAVAIISIIKAKNAGAAKISGIYNFSNEGVCSWYDFAQEIVSISNRNCVVKPVPSDRYPTKAQRPFYSVLGKSKIKDTFKIKIPYWKNSLKKCLELLVVSNQV
ncbi:MAG: dTDP-4-dehydrorhamnose reductase [Bacteroidetes bacterium 4572_117]|nr:MAG: dTDP-4-dehydrorhamnose reductase [Bacteroidetes bacterium 4572_117]